MEKFSYLRSSNAGYIDELFAQYTQDPGSVEESWRFFFEGIELGIEDGASSAPNGHAAGPAAGEPTSVSGEIKVADLIFAYREKGVYLAQIDPLNPPPSSHPDLELAQFGLSNADLSKTFAAGQLLGMGTAKLSDILARLKDTYCRTIGTEYMHIKNPSMRAWIQKRLESGGSREALDPPTRKMILSRVTAAETFERFLHTRYVAQKRFSAEGGEGLIPSLDCMIEIGAELGATDFVLGMAHRGRLNVLANIMGKKPEMILTEFEGNYPVDIAKGEGDVKYHKGYSSDFTTRLGKQVHLSLASNPSHLEFVNPVIEGMARAKQATRGDEARMRVIPIQIHGDAAFAGQGVVYETLNLSQLEGYKTGGTLHLVINNQVGFTTNPSDSRSTTYCTDLARMLDSPIFHVNGDDPEAVWFVSKIATEFRQKFKADVFIDLVCYRKHGHNEGDEPSFTQPLLYKKIKAHPSTRELYAQSLMQAGVLSEAEAQSQVDAVMARMTEAQAKARAENPQPSTSVFQGVWQGLRQPGEKDLFEPAKTAVDAKTIRQLSLSINHMPEGFHLHPKLTRFFDARLKSVEDGKGIDWGNGESLAYATLLHQGFSVRLSGQDAERGTFTHRHAVLKDFETGQAYCPLKQLSSDKARFEVYNSHLSETGVLGFEYGYSLSDPATLTLWEAQFGDFANGAQVIIDQFIATSESKWHRMSGLVLLLPHGYEGQGPEHSSARLERFLGLCGRDNLAVCNLTTPAQVFHALRRQMVRDYRKPLVIMSPKSLLRHPQAVSAIEEFTDRGFEEVMDELEPAIRDDARKIKRAILCSGKVYYDLFSERVARKRNDVVILRVEQLYPWPAARLAELLSRYPAAKDIVWVQEEPRNMGAWPHVFSLWSGGTGEFQNQVGGRGIRYVGRGLAAAPAVGSHKYSEHEQKSLVEQALQE